MTITQIDLNPKVDNVAKIDTLEFKSDQPTGPGGPGFGQVMNQLRQAQQDYGVHPPSQDSLTTNEVTLPSGQELAAGVQDMSLLFNFHNPEIDSWSLKAVNLGPTLNVITPTQAEPDAQSLEAFALSQGLDENAVQWLLGKPIGTVASPLLQANEASATNLANVPSSRIAGLDPQAGLSNAASLKTNQIAGFDLKTGAFSLAPQGPTAVDSQLTAPSPDQSGPPSGSMSNTSTVSTMDSMSTASTVRTVSTMDSVSTASTLSTANTVNTMDSVSSMGSMGTVTPAASAFTTGAALWALALNEDVKPPTPTTRPAVDSESAEAAAIQIQLMRQPMPAAVWMLRTAMPQEVKPERANAIPSLSESELDLGADFNPELVDGLIAGLENEAAPTPMASTAHPGAMSSTRQEAPLTLPAGPNNAETAQRAGSDATERSENIQNLAEKMGQAVGKRMLTEIEKGQWHLKLQLRPATLGHIEVEMRMLSGQLDAVFNAPQALTRELLQEGMTRLKETLNQMGMDVASMQVKDGQTRQNGGKSTPNQATKSTDLVNNDSKSTNSSTTTVARHKMGEDGWDVLV